MFREDYILRIINQVVAALHAILGLKKAGQYQEALQLVDQNLELLVGLKAYLLKQMSEEGILALLTQQDRVDSERLAVVATLYREEGELYAAQGRSVESRESAERALGFFLEVAFAENSPGHKDVQRDIEELVARLGLETLTEDRVWAVFGYFEYCGAYQEAERVLLMLQARPGLREEVSVELKAYYTRLLEKPAAELAKNGLDGDILRKKYEDINTGQ